jgi:hypothetical protein
MIAVETMITKLEEGYDKISAATFAYTSTAFPMLTGTLVTVAGFIPVGFAASGAGEYTFTLFAVVAVALIASWFVAVLFTPLVGVFILPDKLKGHGHEPSRFARVFQAVLDRLLRMKYVVIAATVGLFFASLVGMQFVQQQFFPSSIVPSFSSISPCRKRLRSTPRAKSSMISRRSSRLTPKSSAGRFTSAAAPSASTCRSTSSSQRLLRAGRRSHQGFQSPLRTCSNAYSLRCNGRSSSRCWRA